MSPESTAGSDSLSVPDWLWLGAVALLAATLRLWGLSEVGIDHFDEGVYAFTGLGWSDSSQPLRAYPDQLLFSPPLYPFLVSISFRLLGATAVSAVLVNVVLGVVTVLALGLIGTRWFGRGAGVAAALLLAVDPLHVMLSRSALTDIAFLLFFLLALAAAVEAFQARSWRWAVVTGFMTGLAWNTKYHGWFVLLIAGWGLLACLWRARMDPRQSRRLLTLWVVMAAVATLCYLPWAIHIHGEMGYRSFLAYQGSNVSGTWWSNLARQVGQQALLESTWSRTGPALAALAVVVGTARRARGRARGRTPAILVGVALSGLILGQAATLFILLCVALVVGVRAGAPVQVWLLAGWTALWVASAPLYDPYARLLLPLWAAASLGCGWILSGWLNVSETGVVASDPLDPPPRRAIVQPWGAAAVVVAVALLAFWRSADQPGGPWRPSDTMERAAAELAEIIPAGERVVVVGEPTLAFYLHRLDRPAFERTDTPAGVAAIDRPVHLVVGRYVRSAEYLRTNLLDALSQRLDLVDRVHAVPSDLRVLDDLEPDRALAYLSAPDSEFDVILYRLNPDGPS